jgi:hypothetical protein
MYLSYGHDKLSNKIDNCYLSHALSHLYRLLCGG